MIWTSLILLYIRNLCLHPTLTANPNFDTEIIRNVFDFIQDDTFSSSKLAQSFYLLHGSKSDYSNVDLSHALIEFRDYFLKLVRIETIEVSKNTYEFNIS